MGAERGPEPAGEPARRTAHRPASRVARQRAGERDQAVGEPLDLLGRRPLLRSEDLGGALERDGRVAEHLEPRAPQPAGRVERVDRPRGRRRWSRCHPRRPGSVPGRPRSPRRSARRSRRCSLASGSRSSGSTRASPEAAATSTTAVLPSRIRPNSASIGRPSGPCAGAARRSPPRAWTSTAIVPSPPSAAGQRSGARPARSTPRPIASATSRGSSVPLNESGATR